MRLFAPQDDGTQRFARRWLLAALLLHLLAAFRSEGFHHFDEQMQILEPLAVKLGSGTPEGLAWEFPKRIRPWLQPAVLYGAARAQRAFGDDDPFRLVLAARLLSALLGWLGLVALAACAARWLPRAADFRAAMVASAIVWFLPYLHARPSSESWAGSLFFLGLALLEVRDRWTDRRALVAATAAGLAWALAFQCRYQIALAIGGAVAWYAWTARGRSARPAWLGATLGFLMGTALGALADRWGYGAWTLTPWNYLHANLLEGRAAEFGTSPWWEYFRLVAEQTVPPLSLLLLAAVAATWALRPRHVLTWATLAFVLGHVVIAHKELRFLFPLASAVPLFLVLPLEPLRLRWPRVATMLSGRAARVGLVLLAGLDVLVLALASTIPVRSEIAIYRALYRAAAPAVYARDWDPCHLVKLPMHFYRAKGLECHGLEGAGVGDGPWWLTQDRRWAPTAPAIPGADCTLAGATLPTWARGERVDALMRKIRAPALELYRCDRRLR